VVTDESAVACTSHIMVPRDKINMMTGVLYVASSGIYNIMMDIRLFMIICNYCHCYKNMFEEEEVTITDYPAVMSSTNFSTICGYELRLILSSYSPIYNFIRLPERWKCGIHENKNC
jgi:hypothetical protein